MKDTSWDCGGCDSCSKLQQELCKGQHRQRALQILTRALRCTCQQNCNTSFANFAFHIHTAGFT
jgi:hypothetical protein